MLGRIIKRIRFERGLSKAQDLLDRGDNDSALSILKKIGDNKKDFSIPLYSSIAYVSKGMLEDAEREIIKAREYEPENPFVLMVEGEILTKKNKIEEAYAILKKSYILEPFNVRACYDLGIIEIKRGKLEEAIVYFDKVVKYEKNFAEARVLMMAEMAISKMSENKNNPLTPFAKGE